MISLPLAGEVSTVLLLAVLVNLVAVVVLAVRAWRRRGMDAHDGSATEGRHRCPECGTENEGGYRFCRSCAADIGRTRTSGGDSPSVSAR